MKVQEAFLKQNILTWAKHILRRPDSSILKQVQQYSAMYIVLGRRSVQRNQKQDGT